MAEWLVPVVTAVAAVVAGLGGARIGARAVERTHEREAAARREDEHRAALIGLWAAVNSFGLLYGVYGEMLPKRRNWLTLARFNLQVSPYGGLLIQRLWLVTDAIWQASGRLSAIATAEDVHMLREIGDVLADWRLGDPLPREWSGAIHRLRELIEKEGGSEFA